MSSTRIYSVRPSSKETPESAVRLVRAGNQAQAMRHVAKDTLSVTVASQNDLVNGITKGVKVEDACAESEPLL